MVSDQSSFVCAFNTERNQTERFRSYEDPDGKTSRDDTSILDVALAASAATTFFHEARIHNGDEYVDAALGTNNPVFEVANEMKRIWNLDNDRAQEKTKCFLSIETGAGSVKVPKGGLHSLLVSLAQFSTETEKTAERFQDVWEDVALDGHYLRLNVGHEVGDIKLFEYKRLDEIRKLTEDYIKTQRVPIANIVEILSRRTRARPPAKV